MDQTLLQPQAFHKIAANIQEIPKIHGKPTASHTERTELDDDDTIAQVNFITHKQPAPACSTTTVQAKTAMLDNDVTRNSPEQKSSLNPIRHLLDSLEQNNP